MADYSISVTELKCAVVDPAWRAKWLAGEKQPTFSFAPAGSGPVYGVKFHQEIEAFVKLLTGPDQIKRAAQLSADELMHAVWANWLQAFSDKLIEDGKIVEATGLTERFRVFCERLVQLRKRTKNFENWQDVFIASEQSFQDIVLNVGGKKVRIGAKVDAIRFHPKYHLEVVDYKLTQGNHLKSDLIQLAIYSHILKVWKPGAKPSGTIEYYLPQFQEVHVTPEELADLYSSLVEPVLKEMFDPGSGSISGTGTGGIEETLQPQPEDLSKKIVSAFQAFKLSVEILGVVTGPQVLRVKLKPAPGVKVASLANRAEDMKIALSLHEAPLIKAGKGFVLMDVPRPDRPVLLLNELLSHKFGDLLTSPVAFPIGLGVEGEGLAANLADPNTCHALVAGTSGSGKSEWLKAMVASIALRSKPSEVQFAFIDPKILTFSGVAGSPYLWKPVATALEAALSILRDAVKEMGDRYTTLAQENLVSLGDRFKAGRKDIPFLILVFDEFADLILSNNKEQKKEFEDAVAKIAGKGRAAGIHLVLATQRPDRNVVTGIIKANLPLKVCLRVTNATNSQIVLDEAGGENLYGKGDLLCDEGKGITRAQGLYIPQPEFLEALGK